MKKNAFEKFRGKIDWIELVTHLQCNCSCRVCPSARISGNNALSDNEMFGYLAIAKELGVSGVWFGGGEPTLHQGLLSSIEQAKNLGYQRILLQSNGLRLAYLSYTKRLIKAGLNCVNLSLKGADSKTHDHITRVHGSFDLLKKAANNLVAHQIPVSMDILVTSLSVQRLDSMTELAADLGASRITIMLVSLHGLDPNKDRHFLPEPELVRHKLMTAMDKAQQLGLDVTSLHIPPCLLEKRHRQKYHHAGKYRLLVVSPSQRAFLAETSPTEGGSYLRQCSRCRIRQSCLGFTCEYLEQKNLDKILPIF